MLKVGPQSAGANPGPVCYSLGGKSAALTDANLMLGYLDPEFFLGGSMTLNKEAAHGVIRDNLAKPLNLSETRIAWGIHETASEDIAGPFEFMQPKGV